MTLVTFPLLLRNPLSLSTIPRMTCLLDSTTLILTTLIRRSRKNPRRTLLMSPSPRSRRRRW